VKSSYRGRLKGTGALVAYSSVTLQKEKGSGKSRCIRGQDPSFSDLGINCPRAGESQIAKQGKNTLKKFIYPESHCFCRFLQVVFLKKEKKKIYD